MKFIFFGSSYISVLALNELKNEGLIPSLIVTTPDKPKGRGLALLPSEVKLWAMKENIEFISPNSLKDPEVTSSIKKFNPDMGVLVSYGKIIPKEILTLFPLGILNLHPSMLPHLRGPSPIESSIFENKKEDVGVSIIFLDEEMDHGPILAQEKIEIDEWPVSKSSLTEILGTKGGKILANTMRNWFEKKISPKEQKHTDATYTKKYGKEDSFINLEESPLKNYLTYLAFEENPAPYFFVDHKNKKIRVKIKKASYVDNKFVIEKVIPEGKKEMDYESFLRGIKN